MYSKTIIVGNLGGDVELRRTDNGALVTNINLATSEKYSGEVKTTWHKVVVWGKLAEICSNILNKGDLVLIEGVIQNRQYENQDGNTVYISEIVAREMKKMRGSGEGGGRVGGESSPSFSANTSHDSSLNDGTGEDVPF